MKTINNFDKSSTGTDIEFSGGYDGDRARWEFEENFEVLRHSGYRVFSVLYYIDCGNVEGADEVDFSLKGTKVQLAEYLVDHFGNETKSGYMKWTKDDLLNEVSDHIWDYMNVLSYRECNEEIDEYGMEIVPNKTLEWVGLRGYSQGDYSEIVYCPEDLKKAWGKESNEAELSEIFDNLLWDSPISATLTVSGEEFHYDEEFDWYDWQREEFIEYVSKRTGVGKEVLEAIVPQDLY